MLGLRHQRGVPKYLTGIIENRELHGAFEVLLQNRLQALIQPQLCVVDREDDGLQVKRNGFASTPCKRTPFPPLPFPPPSPLGTTPGSSPKAEPDSQKSLEQGLQRRNVPPEQKVPIPSLQARKFLRSARCIVSDFPELVSWILSKSKRESERHQKFSQFEVFSSHWSETSFSLKQASVYLPTHS